MSERRSPRDLRRRALGQNFLADTSVIDRFVSGLDVRPGTLVLDLGAGSGALTLPLARLGAEVWAVEADPHWAARLGEKVRDLDVRVIARDVRSVRLPTRPYRVVANPPFAMTTELLALLLDDPECGPTRADLVVDRQVARKHASQPPTSLRTAAWAPWWDFSLGVSIDRHAFRPVPRVDATVLSIRRRIPAVLPTVLAPQFRDVLRAAWTGIHE